MTEYNKNNPFPAKIIERKLLNHEASSKRAYHLKLDLTGSGIIYEPGDAIGIFPSNPLKLVEAVLDAMKKTGDEKVVDPRTLATLSLRDFLLTKANLIRVTLPMLRQFPELTPLAKEDAKEKRQTFIENHDILDLFQKYGHPEAPLQELLSYIPPMLPRFYSIASCQQEMPNSVNLLVVTFQCKQGGKMRWGLSSYFLCTESKINKTTVPIYHHPNPLFKIPKNPDTPILMVGPGSGVAPYRAFLKERLFKNAAGKNWLFFGERERNYDFYYKDFFTKLSKQGFLRIDCAFSRDQEEKVYVQHLMRQHAAEIWEWMKEGAIVYICGDAQHMAKDVMATLRDIAAQNGAMSNEEAHSFIREMRKKKRLLLDVY